MIDNLPEDILRPVEAEIAKTSKSASVLGGSGQNRSQPVVAVE